MSGSSSTGAPSPMKPRRLKGHKAAVTSCIASLYRPGVVASSGEDGCICLFDLRCKDTSFTIDVGTEPVSSLCFKGENEDVIYASSGTKVSSFDIHMPSMSKPLESYTYNKEEINQIVFSPKSYFLAAADDSGDVKIIDTRQQNLYKTLRTVHTSVSYHTNAFNILNRASITGGLDSKLAFWDFSKGRACNIIDYGMPEVASNHSSAEQCYNPAFVHCIAVPEFGTLVGLDKVCAVARGDGVIDILDIESGLPTTKPRSSSQHKKAFHLRSRESEAQYANSTTINQTSRKRMQLDYALGGHSAAVSCVSFSLFGERGKFLISGGNDSFVKIWDWSKQFLNAQTSNDNDLLLNINVKRKVNWLCTSPSDSENLIICDTSKDLKVYTVP